ncbi:MAG: 5-oxoprolinase subunit PxpA [Ginsengibacter sp.]
MLLFDINCDMGEGIGNDEAIMPFISSANIACGFHAGDDITMNKTILLAKRFGVGAGAHPSFFDRENFGRTEINLPMKEIYELVQKQVKVLRSVAAKHDVVLQHVKPHGALYNMSAKDVTIAHAIALAVKDYDANLVLYGLSESHSIKEAQGLGLKTRSEVFADRTYQDDGSLTPRSYPNALIRDTKQTVEQALQMIYKKTVTTISGKTIPVVAETICIHGDGKHATEFAKAINEALSK